jgi:putative ATP-dependent endonuclease of OLD family
MKIKSIRISNLFSFGYAGDVKDATGLEFDTGGGLGSFHVLIGPNGSGKSNFVEILTQLLKRGFFQGTTLDENILNNPSALPNELRGVLRTSGNLAQLHLQKTRYEAQEEGRVRIVLELSDDDYANLDFTVKNRDRINELLGEYSDIGISVPAGPSIDSIRQHREA